MSVAARHAEIARRYAWHGRQQREGKAPLTMTTLRTAELERIFRNRFVGRFPFSSAGLDALLVMAEHHLQRNDPDTVQGWIQSRAPWTKDYPDYAADIVRRAELRTSRYTASSLGWRIKLTAEERRYACA